MGIVIRQATQNTIYSYVGALLGFITVWFMNVQWLTTEQNGLLNLLISISIVTGSLSNLGMAGVTIRLFPQFRNVELKHHGYLFYPLAISMIGFVFFLILFFLSRDEIITRNLEKSRLFAEEIIYLIPLTFFWAMFNILDAYSRSVYLSVAGVFIKEVLLRIIILVAGFMLYKGWIGFGTFLFIYCASFCSLAIFLALHLWLKNELHLIPSKTFLSADLKKEIRYVALYSIITGLSTLLISSIDKIIVNDKLGLSAAGIFAVATYFGSIIHIPARSIVRIASSVIADSWRNNDLENIRQVYHKTCLNQFILGLYVWLGILLCINEVIGLMPPEYAEAKYVILFVGLGYLIDMTTGVNGVIIGTSKYFRYDTYFMLLLVVITTLTNLWLIPLMGITGAAIASCITYFLFNALRYIFIWKRFDMQPYDIDFLKILMIGGVATLSAWFIGFTPSPLLNILIKGCVFSVVFALLMYRSRIAPEMNAIFHLGITKKKS